MVKIPLVAAGRLIKPNTPVPENQLLFRNVLSARDSGTNTAPMLSKNTKACELKPPKTSVGYIS